MDGRRTFPNRHKKKILSAEKKRFPVVERALSQILRRRRRRRGRAPSTCIGRLGRRWPAWRRGGGGAAAAAADRFSRTEWEEFDRSVGSSSFLELVRKKVRSGNSMIDDQKFGTFFLLWT